MGTSVIAGSVECGERNWCKKSDFRNVRNEGQVGNGEGSDYRKNNRKKLGEKRRDLEPILFDPSRIFCFCHQHIKLGKFHISVFLGSLESQNRIPWAPCSPMTEISCNGCDFCLWMD